MKTKPLTWRAPLSWWSRQPSLSHGPNRASFWWTALTEVEEAFVVVKGIVSMGVPRGCYGIGVELSGISVAGVGGTVRWGQGVSVHHDLSCLICVQAAGRGHGRGGGPSISSTTAPGSRGLLGALRFGPACGSGTGGQHGHQDHKESGEEDKAKGWHNEGLAQ